jgi:uncharacterized repeat protein (TIGR03806 family)
MEYRRSTRSSTYSVVVGLSVALGCSSDPPGTLPGGQAGNTSTTGGAGSSGGTGQVAGGNGSSGQSTAGDAPVGLDKPISGPFKPAPPVPMTSRWSGNIVAEYSENYTFRVTANAPVRALLQGEQILRDWTEAGSRVAVGSVWLAAGTSYQLEVEAATAVAEPGLVVEWQSPSKHRSAVPKSMLADTGIATVAAVAPFFNGKFPANAPTSGPVKAEPVSGNLGLKTTASAPATVMGIASHPNSPLLYIVGRTGEVKYIDPAMKTDTGKMFIDISGTSLFTGQDSGLMNMVFHPQYGQAGSPNRNYFYLFYVASLGNSQAVRLSRFTATEGANSANKNTEQILIEEPLPATLHRGGGMTFGKDGFLYVSFGEYGNPNNGQDFSNHISGGVIRIDVDQDATKSHPIKVKSQSPAVNANYFIPNDNPFVGQAGVLEEYWTKGERNPHKLTMDSASGRLFIGNVGGNTDTSQEEVNEVVKGGNYGWPFREGKRDLGAWTFNGIQVMGKPAQLKGTLQEANLVIDRPKSCNGVDMNCPSTGNTTEGKCIIGGYVYRGTALPDLTGKYIFGDCNMGVVWATADERAHGPIQQLFASPFVTIVTFGQDRDGELYLAGVNGQIYKIVSSGPPVGDPPNAISKLGVFTDLANMTPAPGLIPYDMSTPLWSDGAKKARWMIVPNDTKQQIDVTADGSWNFPVGTVFVKHFELEQASGPARRLETRFLVHAKDQRYYGVTYRWRADNSDADLQDQNSFRETVGSQTWHYPSRGECVRCHNSGAGYVLGPKTAQFNRPFHYAASGTTANMVSTLQGLNLFKTPLMPASLPQMPSLHEGTAFSQDRARAYLDANCAGCHRPEGAARGNWDGRFSTSLDMQGLIGTEPVEAGDIMNAKVLAPQSPMSSVLFQRLSTLGGQAMPPLAKSIVDTSAVSVFTTWLTAMNLKAKPATPVATPATGKLGLSLKSNGDLAVPLAGTDADGDALDFRISRMPVHGTLEGFGNNLKYRPHPDFVGVDGFTFVVSDGVNVSPAGSVQIEVVP